MIVYIYSKCSTCQNAIRFLEDKGIAFTAKEIKETPPSIAELETMLSFQKGNIKKLLNTSGLLYREMNLSEQLPNMTSGDLFLLLSKEGMLIKRPFLLDKDFGLTGFNEKSWKEQLTPLS